MCFVPYCNIFLKEVIYEMLFVVFHVIELMVMEVMITLTKNNN